jgi:hypothetical protein
MRLHGTPPCEVDIAVYCTPPSGSSRGDPSSREGPWAHFQISICADNFLEISELHGSPVRAPMKGTSIWRNGISRGISGEPSASAVLPCGSFSGESLAERQAQTADAHNWERKRVSHRVGRPEPYPDHESEHQPGSCTHGADDVRGSGQSLPPNGTAGGKQNRQDQNDVPGLSAEVDTSRMGTRVPAQHQTYCC